MANEYFTFKSEFEGYVFDIHVTREEIVLALQNIDEWAKPEKVKADILNSMAKLSVRLEPVIIRSRFLTLNSFLQQSYLERSHMEFASSLERGISLFFAFVTASWRYSCRKYCSFETIRAERTYSEITFRTAPPIPRQSER